MPSGERFTVTALQAATTRFGQFALECDDVMTTIDHALDLVAAMTDAPAAALIRLVEADRVEAVSQRGGLGMTPDDSACRMASGEDLILPPGILSGTAGLAEPLVIGDWQAEERLPSWFTSRLPTVRSSLLVGVSPRGRRETLVVLDTRARRFQATQVDAVVAVVHLLSAAMDRYRRETAQAAVAAFGEFALESPSVQATLQRAVDLATDVLDTAIGFLLRVVGADQVEVLYGRGPLGEPFGGGADLPQPLVEALRSTQPLVTDWCVPYRCGRSRGREDVRREDVGGRDSGVACLTVTVRGTGEIYRLGVMDTQVRRFVDSEVDFLSSISHLLAATLKRDRVEAQLRDRSDALQRALLPASLPRLAGIESAAQYVPSGHDQVGGDWYDVLSLPHGGIGLMMGDVEGHDNVAAAVMGQVRNVVRTYAGEGHPPAEVLSMVNKFVLANSDRLVTCCYAELRPDDLTVTCVTAGHPAPLVIEPDGTYWQLPVHDGMLLGVRLEQDYQEQTTLLPRECTLLLVTDGLVDDTGDARYPGEEAFGRAAAAVACAPLDQMVQHLVACPPQVQELRDDAALLAVRVLPSTLSSGEVERIFTPFTSVIPAARRYVGDVLAHWGAGDVRDAAVLAVSELVTNAVMHTTSSVRLVLKRLAEGVWIGVHDTNDRLPIRPASMDDLDPGGRGLGIVEQTADRWGITPTPGCGGKTVWLELFSSAKADTQRYAS